MTIAEIINELGEVKSQANNLYVAYKEYKQTEDELKQELELKLRDSGLQSAKGEKYTASISGTPRVIIKDEASVLEWLENTPNVEADFYIGVKRPEFQTLAKQMLKETGELANGTELEIIQSLAIRKNKEG